MPKGDKLTIKQLHFCRFYTDPESISKNNAFASAIEASYAHNTARNADKLILANKGVVAEIARLEAKHKVKADVTTDEIVARLRILSGLDAITEDEQGQAPTRTEQIRCLELLGKTKAMFTDNITNSVPDQSKVLTKAEQEQALRDKIKLLNETDTAGTAVAG